MYILWYCMYIYIYIYTLILYADSIKYKTEILDKWNWSAVRNTADFCLCHTYTCSFSGICNKRIASDELTQHGSTVSRTLQAAVSKRQWRTDRVRQKGKTRAVSSEKELAAAARKIAERFPNTTNNTFAGSCYEHVIRTHRRTVQCKLVSLMTLIRAAYHLAVHAG